VPNSLEKRGQVFEEYLQNSRHCNCWYYLVSTISWASEPHY